MKISNTQIYYFHHSPHQFFRTYFLMESPLWPTAAISKERRQKVNLQCAKRLTPLLKTLMGSTKHKLETRQWRSWCQGSGISERLSAPPLGKQTHCQDASKYALRGGLSVLWFWGKMLGKEASISLNTKSTESTVFCTASFLWESGWCPRVSSTIKGDSL